MYLIIERNRIHLKKYFKEFYNFYETTKLYKRSFDIFLRVKKYH